MTREEALRMVEGYLTDYLTTDEGNELESIMTTLKQDKKTGHWIVHKDCEGKTRRCECDNCGYITSAYTWTNPNFCSNCGVKMEGEK